MTGHEDPRVRVDEGGWLSGPCGMTGPELVDDDRGADDDEDNAAWECEWATAIFPCYVGGFSGLRCVSEKTCQEMIDQAKARGADVDDNDECDHDHDDDHQTYNLRPAETGGDVDEQEA